MSVHRRQLRFTLLARQDYDDILVYTDSVWGEEQTELYDSLLSNALDDILDHPHLGLALGSRVPGIRRRRVASHLIFYRVKGDVIEVLRILHERVDVDRHLF